MRKQMMFSLSLSRFGYATRHSISYDPKSKPGLVTLWCSHNVSAPGVGADPIRNGDDKWLEAVAQQSLYKTVFGTNSFVSFSIGSDDDVFSVLVAILMIKNGKDYSFQNFAGRAIAFSRSKVGNTNQEVVLVNIRHKTEIGMLTFKEINEFEIVTRRILAELGYSKLQVTQKIELLLAQSSQQGGENAKFEGHA
jgi:hypothetical protein